VAFQSGDAFYFLGVTLVDGQRSVELMRRAGPPGQAVSAVVASAPLNAPAEATVYLRIRSRGGSYDFLYATRPDAWELLKGDADGTILSTRLAGGFVGTMLGMYAYHPGP